MQVKKGIGWEKYCYKIPLRNITNKSQKNKIKAPQIPLIDQVTKETPTMIRLVYLWRFLSIICYFDCGL